MPYPTRFSFNEWLECRRCGFHWPKDELSKDSFGFNICPECLDDDGVNENKARITLRTESLSSENDML